jgi:hypothetical protein
MANACEFIGHRFRYRAEGTTVRGVCMRGCGETTSMLFATPREARRQAAALNRPAPWGRTRRLARRLLVPWSRGG